MANQKITQLTELTTPASTDLLVIVDDPAGSPVSKKITVTNLLSLASGGVSVLKFLPTDNEPPTSNYATLDTRNVHPVLDFHPTTDEEAVFRSFLMEGYAGGGLTVTLYCTTEATSGNTVFQAALERIETTQDIDSDGFAAFQSSGATAVSGTSGVPFKVTITFTDGAQMDSVDAGELFRLKIRRDADDTSATDSVTANDV
ncbi:MAG: hypothetical protein ACW99G_20655, partial [Candidatus Thorarchaeota archaeon]